MSGREIRGLLWGLTVVAFSLTLPATRAAVPSLGVGFVAFGRAIGAGLLAALILWITRQPPLPRDAAMSLIATSPGVVIGFPFLTSFALAHVSASHGAIVVGLLPLSTAIAGALLTGERPSPSFWLTSALGTALLLALRSAGPQWNLGHCGPCACRSRHCSGLRLRQRRASGWPAQRRAGVLLGPCDRANVTATSGASIRPKIFLRPSQIR